MATKRDRERDNSTGEDGEAKCRSASVQPEPRAQFTTLLAGLASYRATAQHEKQQLLLSIARLTCDLERDHASLFFYLVFLGKRFGSLCESGLVDCYLVCTRSLDRFFCLRMKKDAWFVSSSRSDGLF